ncbi:U7 snRNA-associated Sm-like protein LSm10 isoform X2 [Bombyx mori]|uniref:Sm domain-containing protein n=2 Tax=Bombyx TaxID=7090 RepID=A0A8R1WID2_BOMMO|nr:U7 snRNA-associated Sm-like protein LSm10 isoform X1 [Bombyx mori]XP_004928491.1 U7 snRNA-associated Sm-like protein LSm10 isoform X1 [Bombyx mori]XP_021205261.1 U7 snRNA-associated Sm-like protein LSm10 isoform X1 [Bombyx mori]XP_037871702.1 U7 snRNA-associated Sm-like protein LSm10 isoform X1 [Bombyx mori]
MSDAALFIGTPQEKFFYHNTLLCVVNSLQGKNVTVDLRNDTYVCGLIELVDGFMNISFKNAIYCDPQGNEFAFDNLFIHGRNIRYVHIPENMSLLSTIRHEVSKKFYKPHMKQLTEKTRKTKKAVMQHMKVVASLNT